MFLFNSYLTAGQIQIPVADKDVNNFFQVENGVFSGGQHYIVVDTNCKRKISITYE
jgi:hypothetical protein